MRLCELSQLCWTAPACMVDIELLRQTAKLVPPEPTSGNCNRQSGYLRIASVEN